MWLWGRHPELLPSEELHLCLGWTRKVWKVSRLLVEVNLEENSLPFYFTTFRIVTPKNLFNGEYGSQMEYFKSHGN